jgi:hypothetical protein
VIPSRSIPAFFVVPAQAIVESISVATWESGVLAVTVSRIVWRSVIRVDVAFARKELGCGCKIAELRQAHADVLNVGVDAEDLVHHDDRRERAARLGHRTNAGKRAVGDRDPHVPRVEAFGVGGDRRRRSRLNGERETRAEPARDHAAPREAGTGRQAQKLRLRQIQGRPPLLWRSRAASLEAAGGTGQGGKE